MKKIYIILLMLFSCVASASESENPDLFRIAIFDLKTETLQKEVVKNLEDAIKDELSSSGLFRIIPYQEIEIAQKHTNLFDKGKARGYLKLAQRVGADKLLFGSIDEQNRTYKLRIYIMDAETRKIDRDITIFRSADVDSIASIAPAVLWKFYYPNDDDNYEDKSISFKKDSEENRLKGYKVAIPVFIGVGVGTAIGVTNVSYSANDSVESNYIDEKTSKDRAVFDISGFDARATAMAEAYTAVGGGSAGFVYNPATLPYIESRTVGTSVLQYTGFDDDYTLRSITLSYSDRIYKEHYFGSAFFYTGGDGLMNEWTVMTGYSTRFRDIWILPDFTLGANLKFRSLSYGSGDNSFGIDRVRGNAWGIGLDVGGTAQFSKELTGGIAFSDVVNYLRWNNSLTDKSYNEALPRELKLGLAYKYNTFLLFSVDWFKSVYSTQSEAFSFGLEWAPFSFLALRGGWFQDAYQHDRSKITAGAGISHLFSVSNYGKYHISIDYSFEYLKILYNRHNVSLAFEF